MPVGHLYGVSVSNSNRSYLLNLRTLESTLISDPYAERLAQLRLGEVKDWNFNSSFGDQIEGRYYLPPDFDPNKKYPLIVYYYAGTSPTTRIFESTYPYTCMPRRITWSTRCNPVAPRGTGRSSRPVT